MARPESLVVIVGRDGECDDNHHPGAVDALLCNELVRNWSARSLQKK